MQDKCNIYQNMVEKLCFFLFFLQEKVKSSISKLKDLHLSTNSEAVKEATGVWKVAHIVIIILLLNYSLLAF